MYTLFVLLLSVSQYEAKLSYIKVSAIQICTIASNTMNNHHENFI